MAHEEERCAQAKRFERIDDAFRKGDLDALRAAVDDPALVPNGRIADTIGSCLVYAIHHSLSLWLNKEEAVHWQTAWGPVRVARLEDDGKTLITEVRIDRRALVAGLFYGVEGMHVGGMRRLEIAPHLAYGDRGVPGIIPAGAVLTAEIASSKHVLRRRIACPSRSAKPVLCAELQAFQRTP